MRFKKSDINVKFVLRTEFGMILTIYQQLGRYLWLGISGGPPAKLRGNAKLNHGDVNVIEQR